MSSAVTINAGTPEQVAKQIADQLISSITTGDDGYIKPEFKDGNTYREAYLELFEECLKAAKGHTRTSAKSPNGPIKRAQSSYA